MKPGQNYLHADSMYAQTVWFQDRTPYFVGHRLGSQLIAESPSLNLRMLGTMQEAKSLLSIAYQLICQNHGQAIQEKLFCPLKQCRPWQVSWSTQSAMPKEAISWCTAQIYWSLITSHRAQTNMHIQIAKILYYFLKHHGVNIFYYHLGGSNKCSQYSIYWKFIEIL